MCPHLVKKISDFLFGLIRHIEHSGACFIQYLKLSPFKQYDLHSGESIHMTNDLFELASDFLKSYSMSDNFNKYKSCVMFDIDETLLFSDDGKKILPVCDLLDLAIRLDYIIVIVTARPDDSYSRFFTEQELYNNKIYYDILKYAPGSKKSSFKKSLIDQGYTFVLSVGDMWWDLTDSLEWLKMPSFDQPYIKTSIACHNPNT